MKLEDVEGAAGMVRELSELVDALNSYPSGRAEKDRVAVLASACDNRSTLEAWAFNLTLREVRDVLNGRVTKITARLRELGVDT